MKHLTLTLAILFCLSLPCSALTLFQTDYDGDSYATETVYEGDWLPLRKLSEVLPYEVEWSEQKRTVYIYADRTWTIKPDWFLPEGVKIVDGVTYVSPAYMKRFLPTTSFMYNGELYVFNGETKHSNLVRGIDSFRANTLTTMYRIKLALPEDYKFIRKHLTGGIHYDDPQNVILTYAAYIYPSARRPVAHIVSNNGGVNLAELIAHEAYHVYLHRCGKQNEDDAIDYGHQIKYALLNIS